MIGDPAVPPTVISAHAEVHDFACSEKTSRESRPLACARVMLHQLTRKKCSVRRLGSTAWLNLWFQRCVKNARGVVRPPPFARLLPNRIVFCMFYPTQNRVNIL
jgi:hypothetical protein